MPDHSTADSVPATGQSPRVGLIRRMYNWVLGWAETPWGTPALFGISFAESSFFPIPPDVLQIALSVSRPRRAFFYAAVSMIASVLGAVLGWYIGYVMWPSVSAFFIHYVPGVTETSLGHVGELYRDNATWSILAAAFTPIPFKVFTISAGMFSDYVSLTTLVVASIFGRGARFFLVASLIFFFGPGVRSFMEKRLELMTIALFVMVVLGFVAIKTFL